MEKVDPLPVDLGDELCKCVEPRLVRAPVIARLPVRDQLFEICQGDTAAPADSRNLAGPTGPRKAILQVIKGGLGNSYGEWLDLHAAVLLLHVCLTATRLQSLQGWFDVSPDLSVPCKGDKRCPRFLQ